MNNTKVDGYELFIITNEYQVFAFDFGGKKHQLSPPDFASDIAISDNGTLWAITRAADQEAEGGANIFWSLGDGIWNEITTPNHGGVSISGGPGSSCFYKTTGGIIRKLDTTGSSEIYDDKHYYSEFDYGAGMVWAVFSMTKGGIPRLYYCEASDDLSWKPFIGSSGDAEPRPRHISVGCYGNCYGISEDNGFYYYIKDGKKSSEVYGLDSGAMDISANGGRYAVVYDTGSTTGENLVYQWRRERFEKTSICAMKVLSNYPTAYPDNMKK